MLLTKLTMVGGVRSVQELELLQCGALKMALLEQDLSRFPENIQPMQLESQNFDYLSDQSRTVCTSTSKDCHSRQTSSRTLHGAKSSRYIN